MEPLRSRATCAPCRAHGRPWRPSFTPGSSGAWRERQRSPQTMVCRRRPSSRTPQPAARHGYQRCGGSRTETTGRPGLVGRRARCRSGGTGGVDDQHRPLRRANPASRSSITTSIHRATGFPHQYGVIRRNSAARVSPRVVLARRCPTHVGTPGQRRRWLSPCAQRPPSLRMEALSRFRGERRRRSRRLARYPGRPHRHRNATGQGRPSPPSSLHHGGAGAVVSGRC